MALFGLDFYGASRYGPRVYLDFDASPLVARPTGGYGQLDISWTTPVGDWSEIRLIRSTAGSPVNQDDGVVLVSSQSGPAANPRTASVRTYSDTNLEGGRFQYYAVWVYVPGVGEWTRAATTLGLPLRDYGYSNRLWDLTPSILRTKTTGLLDADNMELKAFESVIGYQLDGLRAPLETLRDVNDPERVSGNLLPLLAQQYGQFFEPELGMKQMRTLMRDTLYLYRNKGTTPGVTGFVKAVSGYGADVQPLLNLMLDYNDSSAEESVGRWVPLTGCTLTRYVSDGAVAAAPASFSSTMRQVGLFQVNTTAAGAFTLRCGTNALLHGIPVTAGTAYSASMYIRNGTGTARALILDLEWYTAAGVLISTTAGSTTGNTAVAGTWATRSTTLNKTAPATAVYMMPVIRSSSGAIGEVHYFDAIQIEAGAMATSFEDARMIDINARAPRVNNVTNPSFEVDTASWIGASYRNLLTANQSSLETDASGWLNAGNASLARSTLQALNGSASLSVTAVAAGDVRIETTPQGTSATPVVAGQVYTVVASFRAGSVGRAVQPGVYFYTSTGAAIGAQFGATTADNTAGWTQASFTVQAPANAAYVSADLKVLGCAAGEVHYVDAVGLFPDPTGNLVANPDFENGTTGWSSSGTSTATASTDQSYTGRQSLLLGTAGGSVSSLAFLVTGPTQTLTSGVTYTYSAWVRSTVSTTLALGITNVGYGPATAVAANTWARLTQTFTGPAAGSGSLTVAPWGVTYPSGQGVYVDAVQVVVGSAPVEYLPPTTHNLVTNPSFEVDRTGWTDYNHAPVRSTEQAYVGTASAKNVTAAQHTGAQIQNVSTVAGTTYTVSAYVKRTAGTGGNFRIDVWDVTPSAIYDQNVVAINFDGTWQRFVYTFTARNSGGVHIYFAERSGASVTWFLDAVQLEAGSVATPYVDGSLGAGYSWEASENLLSAAASSFEDGTTGGWVSSGGTHTLANSAAQFYSGTKSLAMTVTGAGTQSVGCHGAPPSAVAPATYTMSVWVRTTVARSMNLYARTVNAAQNAVINQTIGATVAVPANTWTRLVTTVTAEAGTATVDMDLVIVGTQVNDVIYVDAAQIEQKDHATAYAAPGTAHASTSRRQTVWSLGGSGATTLTRVNEVPVPILDAGSWLLRVNHTQGMGSGAETDLVLTPGAPYIASAYARTPGGDPAAVIQVTDDKDVVLGSSSAATVYDAWQRLSVPFLAPASGSVRLKIIAGTAAAAGDYFYVDAVMLEGGGGLQSYFDGSTYASVGDSLWEVGAHSSRSHYYPQRRAKNARINALLPSYLPAGTSSRVNYALPLA